MLQEILLSLSGVPSPALSRVQNPHDNLQSGLRQHASVPERAMLDELAHLSLLHFEIKKAASTVQTSHKSPICRAVSSAILTRHLGAFRQKITKVENSILRKDSAYVGGYDIVPLSTIVTEFAPWTRRLEWLRRASNFMSQSTSSVHQPTCSGAALLEFLERETHTGYSDIEMIATQLLSVGETSWMRMVSSWLLYGNTPDFGHEDFMVQQSATFDTSHHHLLNQQLVPHFVTATCAESILGTGNALNQIRQQRESTGSSIASDIAMKLLPQQLKLFQTVKLPLNASKLEAAMHQMNALVSENALSQLLPLHKILEIASMIQSYLLLGRGEYAIALINNVDERLQSRDQSHQTSAPVRKLGRLESLVLKDAELNAILLKTWSDLSSLQSAVESEDDVFTSARKLLRLTGMKDSDRPEDGVLISTLTPTATLLRIDIPIDSPMNIFITRSEIAKYSHINSHLISIRRCQIRLANLWKLTAHRRCHPSPLAPPASATEYGRRTMTQRRRRESSRSLSTRSHWSLMSKVLFVTNELAAYLQGEVIQNSWSHFHKWLTRDHDPRPMSSTFTSFVDEANGETTTAQSPVPVESTMTPAAAPRDPRTIAQAHQQYLDTLYKALFIDKQPFNESLSTLLNLVDHFAALFNRLQTVWQGLDLQEDDGIVDAFMNYAQDEKDILAEMGRSSTILEQTLKDLVQCIKDIEADRNNNDVTVGVASIGLSSDADGKFVPWRARTLDRLIMKLDFLRKGEKDVEPSAQDDEGEPDD